MKILAAVFAAGLSLASAGPVLAACQSASSASSGDVTGSISKDGTHAPLDTQSSGAGVTETDQGTTVNMAQAESGGVSKDGKTMPLAGKEGGGDPTLATSPADVKAQQSGEETAQAMAGNAPCQN